MGKQWKQWQTILGVSKSLQPWNQKTLAPWKKSYDQPRQHIKKQRHYFANKCPSSQRYGFSSSLYQLSHKESTRIWELDHKASWGLKNWCFWNVMLEKTLESPVDCKEIEPVNPKGNQSWVFIGRTDAEAETPILWPHHQLDGHEFEQASGVGDGQGGLACCSPWCCRESDTTERLNWTDWNCVTV